MGKGRLGVAGAACLALAALGIAACGSSNDNSADEDQITQAITAAATSGDPSACTKYQTQQFLEQTNSGTGQAAVQSCEKDAQSTAAEHVDVSDIEVSGDTATAKAKATGSIFDGQTLDIALVKENDQWKLDQFKGFEDFNKAAIIAAAKKQFASEGTPAPAINCIGEQLQAASDADIEATFTGSNSQAENRIFGACAKYFQGQ